jgi:hypothetical protein
MPAYTLDMRPRARRALRQLDPTAQQAITAAIDALAADPHPPGAVPIKGHRPYYVFVSATTGSSTPSMRPPARCGSPWSATGARSTAT